ncbi:MAG: hypothetical protein Q7S60_04280 [bacterium]|nr:hypothetical protein [bacterium]
MSSKIIVYFFMFAGSLAGAYIPTIWGAGFLSISSLVFSTIGAIVGVFVGLKFTK